MRAFRGRIRAVGGAAQLRDARRQSDDPAPIAHAPRGFAHDVETAFHVHRHHAIEVFVRHIAERRQAHDARIADNDVDTAKGLLVRLEQTAHGCRVADVGLLADGSAARLLDLPDHARGQVAIAQVVDRDAVALRGQSTGNRSADATRRAGDQRHLAVGGPGLLRRKPGGACTGRAHQQGCRPGHGSRGQDIAPGQIGLCFGLACVCVVIKCRHRVLQKREIRVRCPRASHPKA